MRKWKSTHYLAVLFMALLCMSAYPGTIAEVTVFKRGKVVQTGIGSLVAEEKLLVSWALVTQGDQLVVKDQVSAAKYVGTIAAQSEEADLALLSVTGLQGDNFNLATESSVPGRKVTVTVLDGKVREGVLHSLLEVDQKNPLPRVQHTAVIQDGEFGAPLLNNCGELLGIIQSGKKNLLDKRLTASKTFSVVGDLQSLTEFLSTNSVDYEKADEKCLSEKEQLAGAKSKAKSTAEEIDILKKEQEQLEEEQEQLKAEKEEIAKAKKQLESLTRDQKKALAEKEEEVRTREEALKKEQGEKAAALKEKQELEEQRAAQEEELKKAKQQKEEERLYIAGGSSVVILVLALAGWLVSRKRKAQLLEVEQEVESSKHELSVEQAKFQAAQSELEQSAATFNDIVLLGLDEEGKEHRTKVIGNALIRSPHGQIIGRSAQKADYVINLDQVSREHVRLSVQSGQVVVEDLGSYNGTAINGKSLDRGESGVINHSDELRIGTLVCRVHIME